MSNARLQRARRTLRVWRLTARNGARFVAHRARRLVTHRSRHEALDSEFAIRTANDVARELGNMKGALMKFGQLLSFVVEALPPEAQQALSALQSDAPPMAPEAAAAVVRAELGAAPQKVFLDWQAVPVAAASIGQVHRAVTRDGRDVAVKVQYPGVGDAIETDLNNTEGLYRLVGAFALKGLDTKGFVDELRDRMRDELDYRLEAGNQREFAAHFAGHPFVRIPIVDAATSSERVLTTEWVEGIGFAEFLATATPAAKQRAGEGIWRFAQHAVHHLGAFNGDPHPGNYLFHRDGRITFLDFGLVKHFSDDEMATFIAMVRTAAFEHDMSGFRAVVERAGMLRPGCPSPDAEVGTYFSQFYEAVSDDHEVTWSSDYASRIVRHTFDRTSPIAQYATVPKAFVFIQRINLGLYALLGELQATGNYRRIAEELWPFVAGPPSTGLAVSEQPWLAHARRDGGPQ